MRYVPAAVDAKDARARLLRRWKHRIGAALRWPRGRPEPDTLELVWLPVHLVGIALLRGGNAFTVTCWVDGLRGSFALVDMDESAREGEPEGDVFGPRVDADEAERIARASLITVILRRRSKSGKPTPGDTVSRELLRWPFWVYYHRRARGRIDIDVLDAVTGRPAGQKIKLGILDAFRDADARAEEGEARG